MDVNLIMLPLLETLKDGRAYGLSHLQEEVTKFIEMSDHNTKTEYTNDLDMGDLLDSALEHLRMADLIHANDSGLVRITPLGKMVLGKRLNVLDIDFLKRLPGYDKK